MLVLAGGRRNGLVRAVGAVRTGNRPPTVQGVPNVLARGTVTVPTCNDFQFLRSRPAAVVVQHANPSLRTRISTSPNFT
jgi:hypothetical protein